MPLTDLIGAMVAVVAVMLFSGFTYRRYQRLKHPPPTLEEKTQYYEELNEALRREQEGDT